MKTSVFILAVVGLCAIVAVAQTPVGKDASKKALIMYFMGPSFSEADYQLTLAVSHCDDAQAEDALKNGADPNFLGLANETQLMLVCQKCQNDKLAKVLLKYGAKPDLVDEGGYTALMYASQENNPEMAEVLLEHGANPNLTAHSDNAKLIGTEGFTSLMLACQHSAFKVMQTLLAHGADAKTVGANGQTALDIAKQQKQKPMIELLEQNR